MTREPDDDVPELKPPAEPAGPAAAAAATAAVPPSDVPALKAGAPPTGDVRFNFPAEEAPPREPPLPWPAQVQAVVGRIADDLAIVVGFAAVAVFAILVWRHPYPCVPETDCSAYFMMAQKFSQFAWPAWPDDLWRFADHPWVTVNGDHVMAKYAPGYPFLLAIGYFAGGLDWALRVGGIVTIVGALGFWVLSLYLLRPAGAAVSTIFWLFASGTLGFAVYPLTHGCDAAVTVIAALFAYRYGRFDRPNDGTLAGLCAGFLPALRPTNVLLWPAVVAIYAVGVHQTLDDRARRDSAVKVLADLKGSWCLLPQAEGAGLAACILAFLMPVGALVAYNWYGFGAPWRTGYALSGEQTGFALASIPVQYTHWVHGLWVLMPAPLLLLAIVGLPFHYRIRGLLAVIGWWIVPTCAVFWCYYYFSEGTPYLRFFLITVPAFALCAGLLAARLAQGPAARLLVIAAVIADVAAFPPPAVRTAWYLGWGGAAPGDRPALLSLQMLSPQHPLVPAAAAVRELVLAEKQRVSPRPLAVYASLHPLWTSIAAADGVIGISPEAFAPDWRNWPGRADAQGVPRRDPSRSHRLEQHLDHPDGFPHWQETFLADLRARLQSGSAVLLIVPTWSLAAAWLKTDPQIALDPGPEVPADSPLARRYLVARPRLVPATPAPPADAPPATAPEPPGAKPR